MFREERKDDGSLYDKLLKMYYQVTYSTVAVITSNQ